MLYGYHPCQNMAHAKARLRPTSGGSGIYIWVPSFTGGKRKWGSEPPSNRSSGESSDEETVSRDVEDDETVRVLQELVNSLSEEDKASPLSKEEIIGMSSL